MARFSGRAAQIRLATLLVAGADHFEDEAALAIIEEFVVFLWNGDRSPARLYIEKSNLDLILTMADDYRKGMKSDDELQNLVDRLQYQADRAANMEW